MVRGENSVLTLTKQEIRQNFLRRRKETGLCASCGAPLDRQGVLCKECNDNRNEGQRKDRAYYQKNHVCPRCCKNSLFGDEKNCPECAAKQYEDTMKKRGTEEGRLKYNKDHASWAKKEYDKRLKDGMCGRCGKRKADDGYKSCSICRIRERNKKREREQRKNNRPSSEERVELGICFFCDEKVKDGYKVCEKHYQSCLEKLDNDKTREAREKLKRSYKRFFTK